jgi:hypothetical protein
MSPSLHTGLAAEIYTAMESFYKNTKQSGVYKITGNNWNTSNFKTRRKKRRATFLNLNKQNKN